MYKGQISYRDLWLRLTLKMWCLEGPFYSPGMVGGCRMGEVLGGKSHFGGRQHHCIFPSCNRNINAPLHFKMKVAHALDAESVSPWISSYDARRKAMRWSQSSMIAFAARWVSLGRSYHNGASISVPFPSWKGMMVEQEKVVLLIRDVPMIFHGVPIELF